MNPNQAEAPRDWQEAFARGDMVADAETTLIPVHNSDHILPQYHGTPVATLLGCHNLGHRVASPSEPQLIVVTCMDHRVAINIPEKFAFSIRSAGATVDPLTFNVACALALTNVRAICVVGHSDCAMVDVERHRNCFVDTVTRLGPMTNAEADQAFESGAHAFGCTDAVKYTIQQCANLHRQFPEVLVSPLFFAVENGMLSQIALR